MVRNMTDTLAVLICCRNSEESIETVLKIISKQNPDEIIIIDGNSIDKTVEIARKYTALIFSDEGKGLGHARKLGAQKTTCDYLCIVSPDDIISDDFLANALLEIKSSSNKIAALLGRKKFASAISFWDKGQDSLYQLVQCFPIRVVGNPSIYKTHLLKEFSYDETFSANEDTDLCERWFRAGYKVEWSKNCWTLELENRDYNGFKDRYRWYGQGDYRFVKKWYSIDRKVSLRHLFHPLKNYMLKYPIHFIAQGKFGAAGFSFLCGVNRYKGFFFEMIKKNKSQAI